MLLEFSFYNVTVFLYFGTQQVKVSRITLLVAYCMTLKSMRSNKIRQVIMMNVINQSKAFFIEYVNGIYIKKGECAFENRMKGIN